MTLTDLSLIILTLLLVTLTIVALIKLHAYVMGHLRSAHDKTMDAFDSHIDSHIDTRDYPWLLTDKAQLCRKCRNRGCLNPAAPGAQFCAPCLKEEAQKLEDLLNAQEQGPGSTP